MSTKFGWCNAPEGARVTHEVCPIKLPHAKGRVGDQSDPSAPDWIECGCECHDALLGRQRDAEGALLPERVALP